MDQHQHYYHEARSGFFRWEDDGQVLVWDNGLTICFRPEMRAVMERLAANRLPPLNAIAVLLSACQNNWPEARWFLALLCDDLEDFDLQTICRRRPAWNLETAKRIRDELDRINHLPQDLRSNLSARCELAAMVFERCSRKTNWPDADASHELVGRMAEGLPESLESQGGLQEALDTKTTPVDTVVIDSTETQLIPSNAVDLHYDAAELVKQLECLQSGLRLVTEDTLRRRLKTGVEDELHVPDADHAEDARSLIGQLMQDEELGGLARLAKDLLALLTFPRPLSQPEDLPLGGVSDITNRGQLDSLLLSELAHDDMTLATRIALNEALYLNRESPPSARSQHRQVLLDTGLCMWGVPRLFATAAGLSMAAAADANVSVDFCRAVGQYLTRVDLASREGIQDHLEQLSADLSPTAALPSFFDRDASPDAEYVIVTDEDVWNDDDFRRQLKAQLPEAAVFIVTVTRLGQLTLSSINQQGTRILKSGRLNLDDILTSTKKRPQLHTGDPNLPILLQQDHFPLRMFHPIDAERGFRTEQGIVMCTNDGRLMLWDQDHCGAVQLTDKLGKGRVWWCGFDRYGVPMLVFGPESESTLKLVRIHQDGTAPITVLTYKGTANHVSGFEGYVFLEFRDRWEMFRSGRSESVAQKSKPEWVRKKTTPTFRPNMSAASRFIWQTRSERGGQTWCALAQSNGQITLQQIPPATTRYASALIDRRGYGVIAIRSDGKVKRLYGDEAAFRRQESAEAFQGVSADGSRIVLGPSQYSNKKSNILLTDTFQIRRDLEASSAVLNLSSADCAVSSIRKNFRSIAVTQGRLILRSKKGTGLLIYGKAGIHLTTTKREQSLDEMPFAEVPSPLDSVFNLQVATWPCGSRAYLDSRGLLHLVSCAADVPQVSLVLHEGRMSGWCEAGGEFGLGYCMPDGADTPIEHDQEIYVKAIEGFAQCINSQ